MIDLKEAAQKGKIDQFIAEQEAKYPAKCGDMDKLDAIISHPVQEKSKAVQGASAQDTDGD